MTKHFLDTIIDDREIIEIRKFLANDVMREAVRKVILAELYNGTLKKGQKPDPLRNFTLGLVSNVGEQLTNDQLGAQLRASWEGIRLLELGFSNLARYKDEEPTRSAKENPAI